MFLKKNQMIYPELVNETDKVDQVSCQNLSFENLGELCNLNYIYIGTYQFSLKSISTITMQWFTPTLPLRGKIENLITISYLRCRINAPNPKD